MAAASLVPVGIKYGPKLFQGIKNKSINIEIQSSLAKLGSLLSKETKSVTAEAPTLGEGVVEAVSQTCKGGIKGPSEYNISSKQFGKKWGKHKIDYPEFSIDGYKYLIDDIFNNPEKIIYDVENNEYLYLKGHDLLRLTETGEFVSLYPGAETGKVMSAIEQGGLIWPK